MYKFAFGLWASIAQVMFLHNVVSRHIQTTLVTRSSCAMLSHSDNIAQGFYLSNGCPKSIKTTLNINFSNGILPGASKTTLHKVFPVQCCPRRYFWEDIAQIKTLCSVIQEAPSKTAVKTLCNVVLEAPDNNVQEKVLFVFVLILFVQHRTGQIPMQCCPKDSRPHCI